MENREYVEESKVKEEWINGTRYISPSPSPNQGAVYAKKMITMCFNGEEKEFKSEDMIKVNIFKGLEIDLSKVKLT